MKTSLALRLTCYLVFFFSLNTAFAQLDTIIVEQSNQGLINTCDGVYPQPEGTTTYRIYALLEDPTDHLSAMYALLEGPSMYFNTTTSFFNSEVGGALGNQNNLGVCPFFPEAGFNSFLTIGMENGSDPGTVFAAFTNPQDPFSDSFSLGAPGNSFFVQDGVVFATVDQPNSYPSGEDNRILLAQLTTDGDLGFQFALQIFNEGNGDDVYIYQTDIEEDEVNESGTYHLFNGVNYGLYYQQGCMDESACNYNPDATHTNNRCEYATCSNSDACNYDPNSTCSSPEACIFPGELNNGDCPDNLILELPISSITGSPFSGNTSLDLSEYAGQYVIAKAALLLSNQEEGLSEVELTLSQVNFNSLVDAKTSVYEKNFGSIAYSSAIGMGISLSLRDQSANSISEEGAVIFMFEVPEDGVLDLDLAYTLAANTIEGADANGLVNFNLSVIEHFSYSSCPSDINKDGITNLPDLLALLTNFGIPCQ